MAQLEPYILNPLPPKREKIETVAILRATNRAATALAELKGVAQTIPNQFILVNAIVLQEACDSSEIENIVTTQDELYRAITVNATTMSAATKEVVNYREALLRGFRIIKEQEFLRLNDIIDIQKELIGNNAGLRSTPRTVLKNDRTGEVVYTPPQDKDEIISLLSNFIEHFNSNNSNLSPLIQLGILHYQFESIHPFYDGNGRAGRILNILYLIMNRLLEIPILYLSKYIIDHKQDYYRLLNHTNRTGEWEGWILFMLKAVEVTSLHTIKKVRTIGNLLTTTIEKVKQQAPSIYKKELVELLFEQPYSKISFVVDRLKVERRTASRHLKKLEQIGILRSQKAGRETLYINTELMGLLKMQHTSNTK